MILNYKFVTIEKFIEILKANPEKLIGFTGDQLEPDCYGFVPTGWYGAMCTNLCDNKSILIGYFGDGIEYAHSLYYEGCKDAINEIVNYIRYDLFGTETNNVCIDLDDLNKNGE